MFIKHLSNKAFQLLTHPSQGFGPAMDNELIVFGARRPGFPFSPVPLTIVTGWIHFMQNQGIQQVVCLLPEKQLKDYPDHLLEHYHLHFGNSNVCWVPIDDFKLVVEDSLTNVLLPFLFRADRDHKRVVIHCSGGVGRTGHILAAWLVAKYGFSNQQAIATVRHMGRNAREARDKRLDDLLNACRQIFMRV
jgi:protein-tyrosine phosphatase